jgi:thioredoxin 1
MQPTHDDVLSVNDASFDAEVLRAERPVLLDVSTEWCPPCRALAPVVAAVAHDLRDRLKVVAVDAEAAPRVTSALGVRAFPTLVVFVGGREVARRVGALPRRQLDALLAPYV